MLIGIIAPEGFERIYFLQVKPSAHNAPKVSEDGKSPEWDLPAPETAVTDI